MWLHAGGSVVWAPVLAWAFSAASMGPLSWPAIIGWNGLMLVWGLAAFVALTTTLRRMDCDEQQARAESLLVSLYCLNSMIWALLPFVMWVDGNLHNNYFAIIIIVANTLFVFQLAIHRKIFFIMLVPGLIALSIKLVFQGSAHLLPYAVMAPIFLLWAASLGHQLNNQILQAIRTGLNNRALAEDLGLARDEALRQKQAADDASTAKSSFLATMSHELRTPLNAIIGFAQIIRMKVLGAEAIDKYAAYAGDIEDSGKHLLGLINQILDLAKIEAGAMALSPVEFDLGALIDDCARTMRIKAEEKGMSLSVEKSHGHIAVSADEMAIRQILLNLLSNAVKFTAHGTVRISATREDEWVEIEVTDSGCGIAPEHLERIFQPFEQIDNSLSRRHGGTGLGLPIVAKLAEAHGGTCAVESVVGSGSRFRVRLPIVRRALQDAA